MKVQREIETRLTESFDPVHLEVINESSGHNVPPGSESHFKVVMASEAFAGKNRVARQRAINKLLADLLAGPVHALTMQLHTPEQWQASGGKTHASPACMGGGKHG